MYTYRNDTMVKKSIYDEGIDELGPWTLMDVPILKDYLLITEASL